MKKILLYALLLLFSVVEAKSQDCTDGTILFKEDFGGNLVEDLDHITTAIPECEFVFKVDGDPRGAGNYVIRKEGWHHDPYWTHMDDHTYPNDKTRGYLMQVDASATPGQFYKRQIDDLCAGGSLYFSVWAANSINKAHEDQYQKASLSFVIEDINGNVLLKENTGLMPGTTNENDWNQYGATFTVPSGQSSVIFKILNNGNDTQGNDLVLDDIEIRLCVPPTTVSISPDDTVCKGETVTLTGQFTNDGIFTEPLTYKWFKSATASYNQSDWTEIVTGQTITISSTQSSDAGFYRVAVASAGSIDLVNCRSMSDIVSLTVQDCQASPNYPDNIEDINCFIDTQTITFSIKELARSATEVSLLTNPLCGDIDDDGEVEILVLNARDLCGGGTARVSDAIFVYGFNIINNELYLKYTISVPYSSNFMTQSPIAIAKVDGSRYASVFYASKVDEKLYRYDFDGTQYIATWSTVYTDNINYAIVSPSVTDLMANGRTQICILDKIIDTRTGNILASGNFIPSSGVSNYSFGLYGHTFNANHESMMIPIDIDNDGIKEIIGGDCVYGVQLVNFDTNVGNKFILKQRASTMGHLEIGDGGSAIADIDNDGLLDVVVSCPSENNFIDATEGGVYVYSPQSGEIKNNNVISDIPISALIGTYGPSRPFVGDVDADGFSEICLTGESVLNCYKYNIDERKLSLVWSLPTHDSSGSTTLTMFDFIQDGKARLVYRDEKILQIINASVNPPVIEALIDKVESPTINEFPIVADVNGDGAAEIIVTGRNDATSASNWCWAGELRVYTSATEPWAPARQVWNQSAYNSVNVNADLTIPQYQFNPATVFPGKDGLLGTIDDVRPYNNFLQQQTLLNANGNAVWKATDYKIENNIVATCLSDNCYVLSFGVSNVSELEGADTLNIGCYSDALHTQLIGISLMKKQIQAGGSCTFIDTITTTAENLYIRLNDRGENFPDNYLRIECDYTNNMGHVVLPWCGNTDPPCFNDTTYINGEVCQNDSYTENGFNLPIQTESGEKIYSLHLLSQNGCDSIVQLNLQVLPESETARQVFIEHGESIQIDNQTYSFPTEVISRYTSVSGCDSVVVTTISWKDDSSECDELIPDKYFSPNNDGVQDTWNIKNIECYDGYVVEIYDRFSKLLIRYEGNFTPWNGIYLGNPQQATDYWYLITLKGGKTFSGHFTLKR